MAGTQRARKPPEPAAPAPPCAKRQARSVATWTCQENQDAPGWFVSDLPWKAQRRVRRETARDKVPLPFCGHTITERNVLARGARLPDPPGCVSAHSAGSTFTQRAIFGEASTREEPRRREPPGVTSRRRPRPCPPRRSPTKTWLLSAGERMRKNPGFVALVGPGIPSTDAYAPGGNGDTSTDFLVTFDDDFI
ncbi:hypothetical protein MRX96_043216 [Rhipicephalus microplus]